MSIDAAQLKQVADLARLNITDSDQQQYAQELSAILDFVDQLKAADTEGVEPMAHPLAVTQPFRDDVVSESDGRDDFMSLAPDAQDGLFLVPRVIE